MYRKGSDILRRAAAAFALAALVGMALAAHADAYVYWATGSTIGRSANDGSDVNLDFITGAFAPEGVAVDGAHVYWSNRSSGSVGRANLDGSGADQFFISGGDSTAGVAVDGAHVYWANDGGSIDSIGRADIGGQNVNQHFIDLPPSARPDSVAVNGSHVFWGDAQNRIEQADLDGKNVQTLFTVPSSGSVIGLATDANYIYWADNTNNTVGRANLDGSSPIDSFVQGSVPWGVAVDGQFLYWTNSHAFGGSCGPGSIGTIGRSFITGANADQFFQRCAASPLGIAVDALAPPTPGGSPAPGATSPGSLHSKTSGSRCVVPKLKGMPLAKAKKALKRAHCAVGKVKRRGSSRSHKGKVLSTSPKAGKKLRAGSRVNLTVGRG